MPATAADHPGARDECWHPKVRQDPELEHDADGHAMVDKNGCCEYFRPGKTVTQAKANRLLTAAEKAAGQSGAAQVLGGAKE